MDQPGITVKPIKLISGSSPFCETFLDNAIAEKADLVGTLNDGWTIGKRCFSMSVLGRVASVQWRRSPPVGVTVNLDVEEVGKEYFGVENGKIAEPALRDEAIRWRMNDRALKLSQQRASEEPERTNTGRGHFRI